MNHIREGTKEELRYGLKRNSAEKYMREELFYGEKN